MNAERSRDRIRYVFEALDAAGHPTDTNVAFDFSIVEADIMSMLEKELNDGNTNVALPDFLMEDDTVYITVNPDGYTVSNRYLYQKVETLHEVAALLAREMYPAAAKYEHMPRG
jgi:UDP-glucose 6-dehydrogenase